MADRPSQVIRRRRLAIELRRLRERAGLTGDAVGDRLGWSASKISRIETYRIGLKPADLRRLLDLYEVTDEHRTELQALARDSASPGQLDWIARGLPYDYLHYLTAEQEARTIWCWEPLVVPGLLQTDAYAAAVMAGYQATFRLPPADRERRVELRRMRQRILTRDPPAELVVVIDESVLQRKYGDAVTMRQQLLRLIETSRLPNVDVRMLALGGTHSLGTGSFSLMQFSQIHDVPLNDLVAVEHLTGSYYLEDEEQTHRYRVSFETLLGDALNAADSLDLIHATAKNLWG
ncbi:MAG: helix-turn-helix domain-containing protein [Streptosporangiales bacterium]